MKSKRKVQNDLNAAERHLIVQLRKNPGMMERVQTILQIADNEEGPLKTADEVEGLLIEEMRLLGNTTLTHWATQAQERVSTELQSQDPTLRNRKKKR